MNPIVYLFLAALLVASGLGVVLARSPIRSALSLVVTLFLLAVQFLLLDAPLVAALQVIVYAGAVTVLFLFVIMLLNLQAEPVDFVAPGGRVAGAVLAFLLLVGTVAFVLPASVAGPGLEAAVPQDFGSAEAVAESMFTQHLLAFELTSLLLLVAVVSAVVLAKKELS